MGDAVLLFLAYRDGRPIAGALNFIGADTLYGRYWGCIEEVPFLHFELCYYQAIEWAIEHGLASVQAGAQGEHKLARGYEPVITRSAPFHSRTAASATRSPTSSKREREGDRRRDRMAAARPALPLLVLGVDPDASGRSASAMPRYIAGVVKPQAASPDGATAISPPLPPSAWMSASTASSASCSDCAADAACARRAGARRRRG